MERIEDFIESEGGKEYLAEHITDLTFRLGGILEKDNVSEVAETMNVLRILREVLKML